MENFISKGGFLYPDVITYLAKGLGKDDLKNFRLVCKDWGYYGGKELFKTGFGYLKGGSLERSRSYGEYFGQKGYQTVVFQAFTHTVDGQPRQVLFDLFEKFTVNNFAHLHTLYLEITSADFGFLMKTLEKVTSLRELHVNLLMLRGLFYHRRTPRFGNNQGDPYNRDGEAVVMDDVGFFSPDTILPQVTTISFCTVRGYRMVEDEDDNLELVSADSPRFCNEVVDMFSIFPNIKEYKRCPCSSVNIAVTYVETHKPNVNIVDKDSCLACTGHYWGRNEIR